jgi:TonB family protein
MQSQPDDELIAKLRSNATTASKPTNVSGILRRGREPRTRRLLSFFVIAVAVLLAVFALVRLMKANMGRATASSTAMRPHVEYVTPAEGLIDVTPRKTSRTRNIPKTENLPYPPTVPKSTSSNFEAAGTRAEPTLPPSLATSSDGAKVLGDVIASASPSKAEAVVTPPSKPAVSEVVVGKLDKSAVPIYPQIAKIARVEGVVVLRASVDREGRVREVSVVSGHPMLTAAAADAVKRWRYKPYLLNGEPVEAETTIQINFTLPK